MDKWLKQLIKDAENQGWRAKRTKRGHWMLYPPDKDVDPVTIAGTPSDHRAKDNTLARMKRYGYRETK